VTVLEAIQKSTEFLGKKSVESPRLQTELLLAHLLKMPRMKLYLNFDRQLSAAETDALRESVQRRGRREPLQHIVGSTSFCGLDIAVGPQALIPRPETELLAELGWQWLVKQAEADGQASPAALDFGTGTGCIAIALATKCPQARLTALEVSADAMGLAQANAAQHGVSERITFLLGDGFAALAGAATPAPDQPPRFDLIISNPPYIASEEIATLEPEVRNFDPRTALDGGADGLDFYRTLAAQAGRWLTPGGKIMLEFGDGQAPAIKTLFEQQNWIVEAVQEDYSQRARILIARTTEMART
jgi:release factor glutamine methyltransferase